MTGRFPDDLARGELPSSVEDAFRRVDQFTWELLTDDEPYDLYSYVMSPPVIFDGVFQRGTLMTMAADYLAQMIPEISAYFTTLASSRWCSVPWSKTADALATLYENPERERWFRQYAPNRRHQVFTPLQEADWTSEIFYRPMECEKRFDLVCISRLASFKNLDVLAAALRIYRLKYGRLRVLLLPGADSREALDSSELDCLNQLEEASFGQLEVRWYVDAKGVVESLSQSRLYVLTSLIEGKNRGLHEAMCCNVPVLTFSNFNQHIRGGSRAYPINAGLDVEFTPSALADGIKTALDREHQFSPRPAYLDGFSGRIWSLDCLYQRMGRAEWIASAGSIDESRLGVAIGKCYGSTLTGFVYDETPHPTYAVGVESHRELVAYYREKLSQTHGRSMTHSA